MVSEQFIFQQDSIQLSPSIYQQEHILKTMIKLHLPTYLS